MKEIIMREYGPHASGNGWELEGFGKYRRISRWIKLQEKHISYRHTLYEYSDEEGYIIYFRHNGEEYAINQFFCVPCQYLKRQICYDEGGETKYLSGYDIGHYLSSIYLETDKNCEYVRLYERISFQSIINI